MGTFAQKRQSWNDRRLDRLRAQLAKDGNTPERFYEIVEFHDLIPTEAAELSEQVKWPLVVSAAPVVVQTVTVQGRQEVVKGPPPIVIKSFNPPAPAPKIVIKRY